MEQIYKNIRARRKELGMTQEELAVKAGYKDRSAVAKIESGTVDISLPTFLALAKILKTTPQALIGTSYAGNFPDAFSEIVQIVKDRMRSHPEYGALFVAVASVRPEDVERVTKLLRVLAE